MAMWTNWYWNDLETALKTKVQFNTTQGLINVIKVKKEIPDFMIKLLDILKKYVFKELSPIKVKYENGISSVHYTQ